MAKYASGKYRASRGRTVLTVAIIIFAALFLIIIGASGRVIAENLLIPIFKDVEPSITPLPHGYKSGEIQLPRLNLYCVELNKYDSVTQATRQSEDIRKKGGAGYIFEEADKYRLLVSGYVTQQQALSVAENQADDKYAPAVFLISSGSVSFRVSCPSQSFDILQEACNYFAQLVYSLVDQAIQLEKQEISIAALKIKYSSIAAELEGIVKKLESISSSHDDRLINELLTLYNNSLLQTKKIFLENFQDSIDFFAEIRYNYIQMTVYYCQAVQNLC